MCLFTCTREKKCRWFFWPIVNAWDGSLHHTETYTYEPLNTWMFTLVSWLDFFSLLIPLGIHARLYFFISTGRIPHGYLRDHKVVENHVQKMKSGIPLLYTLSRDSY